jgi:hypothetical protein
MSSRSKPLLARIAHKLVAPAGMTEELLTAELASWAGPVNDKPH